MRSAILRFLTFISSFVCSTGALAFDWQTARENEWVFVNSPPQWTLQVQENTLIIVADAPLAPIAFRVVEENDLSVLLLTRADSANGASSYRFEVLCQSGGQLFEFTGRAGWELPPDEGARLFADPALAAGHIPKLDGYTGFTGVNDCTMVQGETLIRLDYSARSWNY